MVRKDITSVLETYIDEKCKDYAKNKMDGSDWILFVDANKIDNLGIHKFVDNSFPFDAEKYVIKKSSYVKFDKFYEEKLIQILEKLVK